MKLSDRECGEFEVEKLFNVYRTPFFEKRIDNDGKIPYISASKINNGYNFFVKDNFEKSIFAQNHITVEKINLQAFYQPSKFLCSHDVNCLELKNMKMNKNIGLFLVNSFRKQMEKYNYGYICSASRMKKQKFLLPVDTEGNPDYDFMEEYTKSIMDRKVEIYKKYIQNVLAGLEYKEIEPLENKEWKEFFISGENGLFNINSTQSGIDKNKVVFSDLDNGKTPYITRTDINNGINLFISDNQLSKYRKNNGNVITIGSDTQTVFYQAHSFFTGQSVQVIKHNLLNKYNALFLIPLIKIQMKKFNWGGNGATLGRLARTKIMLPINKNNEPDYEYMERYIKDLMHKKNKQYLNYIENKLED